MPFLRAISWLFASVPEAPEKVPDDVARLRDAVGAKVRVVLEGDGPDAWSSVEGDCLAYSLNLRAVLQETAGDVRLMHVMGRDHSVCHYHLRCGEVIIDPTWQQFLRNRWSLPSGLPRIFVGTRGELLALLYTVEDHLPRPFLTARLPMSPERYMQAYYGFGAYADTAKDKTAQYPDPSKRGDEG